MAFLVLADEANFANCSQGLRHTWLFDVREPTNPVSFATMPVPSEADYCAKGGKFWASGQNAEDEPAGGPAEQAGHDQETAIFADLGHLLRRQHPGRGKPQQVTERRLQHQREQPEIGRIERPASHTPKIYGPTRMPRSPR